MTVARSPIPGELGSVFRFCEAITVGVTRYRLGRDDLERPFQGVRRKVDAAQQPRDPGHFEHRSEVWRRRQLQNIESYFSVMPHGTFFTGRSASVIWGLPAWPGTSDDIEVACLAPGTAPRSAGARGSQIRSHLVVLGRRGQLPVLSPESVWVVLGPSLSLNDRIALGDAIVRIPRIPLSGTTQRPPLGTLSELERLVVAGRRVGAERLREALPLLVTQSASVPESHLRMRLREWHAPAPHLDYDVYSGNGKFLGCSEIAYPEYRLALEYEGDHHRTAKDQWNRDIEKYHDYSAAGWGVVRVTASLLYREPELLRARIFEALRLGGWQG